jgi:hypothetical protein
MNNLNVPEPKGSSVLTTVPALAASPALQQQKTGKGIIANPDVWNLKPYVPLGKMLSLKDMFKPVYTLVTNGRSHRVQHSDRPSEGWELQGIVMRGTRNRALFYNSGVKKMKNAGVGDLIDEQLTVKSIGSESVTLEAQDGKKPQRFELHLFNTQKDTYAIKRKTQ